MQLFSLTHWDAKWKIIIVNFSKVYGPIMGIANLTNNDGCWIGFKFISFN